jgi:hypothetical protein
LTGVPVSGLTDDHSRWPGTPPSREKDQSILRTHKRNSTHGRPSFDPKPWETAVLCTEPLVACQQTARLVCMHHV